MGNPIKPAQPVPSSPSPSTNSVVKNSWTGGTQKGDENPATAQGKQFNKKPITVPIRKK